MSNGHCVARPVDAPANSVQPRVHNTRHYDSVEVARVRRKPFGRASSQLSRLMRLEEGMDLAHRLGNPLFGFFPGEDAYFGFRREHRAFYGDGVRMRRDIIRQDQTGVWQLRTKSGYNPRGH